MPSEDFIPVLSKIRKLSNPLSRYVYILLEREDTRLREFILNTKDIGSFLKLSNPPEVNLASLLGHTEKKIDRHLSFFTNNTKLRKERNIINSPAHYTERYFLQSGRELELHVFFDINGLVTKRSLKLENQEIHLTPQISIAIRENYYLASDILNYILSSRSRYIQELNQQSEKLQEGLKLVQGDELRQKLNNFINVIDELNSLYFGYHDTRADHAKQMICRLKTPPQEVTQPNQQLTVVEATQSTTDRPSMLTVNPTPAIVLTRSEELFHELEDLFAAVKKINRGELGPDEYFKLYALDKKIDEVILELTFLNQKLSKINARRVKVQPLEERFKNWILEGNVAAVRTVIDRFSSELTPSFILGILLELIKNPEDVRDDNLEILNSLLKIEPSRIVMRVMSHMYSINEKSQISIIVEMAEKQKPKMFRLFLDNGFDVSNTIGMKLGDLEFSVAQALASITTNDECLGYLLRRTDVLYLQRKFGNSVVDVSGTNIEDLSKAYKRGKLTKHLKGANSVCPPSSQRSGIFASDSSCLSLRSVHTTTSPEVLIRLAERSTLKQLFIDFGYFISHPAVLVRIVPVSHESTIHLNLRRDEINALISPGKSGCSVVINPSSSNAPVCKQRIQTIEIILRCLLQKVSEVNISELEKLLKELTPTITNNENSREHRLIFAEAIRCLTVLILSKNCDDKKIYMLRQELMRAQFVMGIINKNYKKEVSDYHFNVLLEIAVSGPFSRALCGTPLYQKTPKPSYFYELHAKLESVEHLFPGEWDFVKDPNVILSHGYGNSVHLLAIKSRKNCLAMCIGEDVRFQEVSTAIRKFCESEAILSACLMGGDVTSNKSIQVGGMIYNLLREFTTNINATHFKNAGDGNNYYVIDANDMQPHLINHEFELDLTYENLEQRKLRFFQSELTHSRLNEVTGTKLVRKSLVSDELEEEARQMISACEAKDLQRLVRIIEYGINANNVIVNGTTVLHAACKEQWYEGAELLIFNGANIHKKDSRNRTPVQLIQDGEKCEKLLAWWYAIYAIYSNDITGFTNISVCLRNRDANDRFFHDAGMDIKPIMTKIIGTERVIANEAERKKHIREMFREFILRYPRHAASYDGDMIYDLKDWRSNFFRRIFMNCQEATSCEFLIFRITANGTISTSFTAEEWRLVENIISTPQLTKQDLQKSLNDSLPDAYLVPFPRNLYALFSKCAKMGITTVAKSSSSREGINHQIVSELHKRNSLVVTREALTRLAQDWVRCILRSHGLERDYIYNVARVLALEIKFMFSGKGALVYTSGNSPMDDLLRLGPDQKGLELFETAQNPGYAVLARPDQIKDKQIKIDPFSLLRQGLILYGVNSLRTTVELRQSYRLYAEECLARRYIPMSNSAEEGKLSCKSERAGEEHEIAKKRSLVIYRKVI